MTVMSATPQLPSDLLLWRARQRSGDPLPWDDLGIRFLEDDDLPALLDTSYLDEDDLADPGIRANVAAMAETNALIVWVAEEEDGAVFGYWAGLDGPPVHHGFADAMVVTLDTEGQYMALPGRNITEALCAHASDFDDDAFVALAARARDLAAETDPGTAADLIEADALAALPTRAIEGPGRFRDALFAARRAQEEDHGEGRDPKATPLAPMPTPSLSELPPDLVRWRERAAAGETAPWDRFGVRFLADGELPGEVARAEAAAAESGSEIDRVDAAATRLTAERATWVVEADDGRALGYWHGSAGTPIGEAGIILLEPSEWFQPVAGRTLTDALCVDFGEYEDETIVPLVQECRALGFEVSGERLEDFPESEAETPGAFRLARKEELRAAAQEKRAVAAAAATAAAAERERSAPRSTSVVTGELPTVIAALGHGAEDAEVQAALALFGPPFERSEVAVGSVTRTYYVGAEKHADLILADGVFTTAMIWIRADDDHGAYARPEALIDGVGPDTTREQILDRFGQPAWSNDDADRFWIAADAPGKVFVRFEYGAAGVVKISVTSSAG